MHAHQRALGDGTAVQLGLVAHRHVVADRHGTAAVHVQDAGFLDIGAVADQDGVVVAADRYVGPDADARFQRDVADDVGTVGHVGGGVDAGDQVVKLVNGHCLRSPVASRGRRGPCRR
ncbi:hypothetical protein G6F40_017365 [Rhizopus arrhizus]|nr:hypothetical protein G6F40_017365 [Rhizopus arrhizus]